MQTTTETKKGFTPPPGFEEAGSKILSIREFPEGVQGILGAVEAIENGRGEQAVGNYGQPLFKVKIGNAYYWADGGVRGAIKRDRLEIGEEILIVHTGEAEMVYVDEKTGKESKGTVQTYATWRKVKKQ